MSKLSIILCSALLISAVIGDDAAKALKAAKHECMKSINEAQTDSRDIYQQLPTSPKELADAIWDVYQKGNLDLNSIRAEVRQETTMVVTTEVKTAFGKVITCSEDIAVRVAEITEEMSNGFQELVSSSSEEDASA